MPHLVPSQRTPVHPWLCQENLHRSRDTIILCQTHIQSTPPQMQRLQQITINCI